MLRREFRRFVTSTLARLRRDTLRRRRFRHSIAASFEPRGLLDAKLEKDILGNPPASSSSHNFTDVNGTLFFRASDSTHVNELWKSDGTSSGTVLVRNINTSGGGMTGSGPHQLTNVNGTLLFVAFHTTNRLELWKSNGP
jgi:ELWxxDGT repeat protein